MLLLKHRNELFVSRATMAEKLGITREYLRKLELGLCYPSIPMILRIAKILDWDHVELYKDVVLNYNEKESS